MIRKRIIVGSVRTLEGNSMIWVVLRDCIFFAAALFLLFNCYSENCKEIVMELFE